MKRPAAVLIAGLLAVARLGWGAGDRGIVVRSARDAGIGEYSPDKCYALIIGINEYKYWPDLRTAVNDAKSVADALRESYGYKNITLLLDGAATRRGILQALESYVKLTEENSLLIYYAGHGTMDQNLNGAWVPTEAPANDKFSCVANSYIVEDYFKKYRVKHLLVMADSCFSGAMMRGVVGARQQGWTLPRGYMKPSRYIFTSGDLAPVPDDAGGGHSPFATRVLQYLRYSDQPAFSVRDMFSYVRQNLESEVLCEPLKSPQHMPGGEYVFCRIDQQPEPVMGPPEPVVVPWGTLWAKSPMAGQISIDGGAPAPISPGKDYLKSGIKEGTHTVRIWTGKLSWEQNVTVRNGDTVRITADFPANVGSIRVISNRSGDVSIDRGPERAVQANVPLLLEDVPDGWHTVTVSAGGDDVRRTFKLQAGATEDVVATFEDKPPRPAAAPLKIERDINL